MKNNFISIHSSLALCSFFLSFWLFPQNVVGQSSNILGETRVCDGSCTGYQVNSTSGMLLNWQVSGGTIASGNDSTYAEICWENPGNGSLLLTETDPITGSGSMITLAVDIIATPQSQIEGNETECINTCGSVYLVDPFIGWEYAWSTDGGFVMTDFGYGLEMCWVESGTFMVESIITDTSGTCESRDTMVVSVDPPPVVEISGDTSLCEWTCSAYELLNAQNLSTTWVVGNGSLNSGQNTPLAEVCWNQNGAGSISVNVIDVLSGCSANSSLDVNFIPNPTPMVTGPDTVYTGIAYDYQTASPASNQFDWTLTGGSIGINSGNSVHMQWTEYGSNQICVTETQGECSEVSCLNVFVKFGVGISSTTKSEEKWSFYPNPVENSFSLVNNSSTNPLLSLEIRDAQGHLVFENLDFLPFRNSRHIRVERGVNQLPGGIYTLILHTSEGKSIHKMFKL